MANLEVAELVNRSPVDRSCIGTHSIDIRPAIRRFLTFKFGRRSVELRGRRTGSPRYSDDPLPYRISRACFEQAPCWCRAASTGPGRAAFVKSGNWPQHRGSWLGLLGNHAWGLYGCYGVYVVLTERLSCTSRNSHAHRKRTPAGRQEKPAQVSAGCWAGIDRPSIDHRPRLRRRPPLCRAGFTRLPLVYWRAPGDLFKGRLPSPVQN